VRSSAIRLNSKPIGNPRSKEHIDPVASVTNNHPPSLTREVIPPHLQFLQVLSLSFSDSD